jgi:hypothetical protein
VVIPVAMNEVPGLLRGNDEDERGTLYMFMLVMSAQYKLVESIHSDNDLLVAAP